MTQLIALIPSLRNDDEGQGLAEYALILALIAIVAVIALIFLGCRSAPCLDTVGQVRLDTLRQTSRAAGRKAPAALSIQPPRTTPDPRAPAVSNLAVFLAASTISCRFLLMVLALWYSRAALRRC